MISVKIMGRRTHPVALALKNGQRPPDVNRPTIIMEASVQPPPPLDLANTLKYGGGGVI